MVLIWDHKTCGTIRVLSNFQLVNRALTQFEILFLLNCKKGSDVFPWEAIIPLRFLLSRLIEEYFSH